jgi:hypothetical protein
LDLFKTFHNATSFKLMLGYTIVENSEGG